MKTTLPIPTRPFTEAEVQMLTERLELIEAALDEGRIVVGTRPNQLSGNPTNKILTKILFWPDTDCDLVTTTGGALNLLDLAYEFASYEPDQLPEDLAECTCLAHFGAIWEKGKIELTQPQG